MIQRCLLALALASATTSFAQSGNPAVLTGQYNSSRTSANTNEAVLNTTNVNSTQFGKLFSWSVDGEVRAQPLYVPGVTIGGKTTDVVYVATMHNSIYAFDADNPSASPLWQVNFGPSVTAPTANGCPQSWSTGLELGILSTPVIDNSTGTLYAVSAAPSGGGYVHSIHALDITTGKDRAGSPSLIQASVAGNGYNAVNGKVSMGPASEEIQRTALLLANGSVYAGFGNCGPDLDPWHGWVVGYSASNVQNQTAIFNSTPNGGEGGIWQSARGLAVDSAGDLYFTTGNATPSNATTGTASGDAALSDYSMRLLQLTPSGHFMGSYPPPDYTNLNIYDLDFSSSGPMVLAGTNYVLAGGKDGILYVFPAGNLATPVQSFQATGTGPCAYSPSGCDQIHDLAFWNNRLYIWGNNDVLRSFTLSNGKFGTTPTSQNTLNPGETPTSLALSANGTQSGTAVLWATTPDSVLHAYNGENVASELWNSAQMAGRDALPSFSRFAEPTVANGRVYVSTVSNQVTAYGLLSDFSLSTSAQAAKALQGGTATSVTITVAALAGNSGTVNLSISGLPTGVTATFTPTVVSGSGTSILTLSAGATAPTGTYNLIVKGTEGTEVRTANLTYIVTTNDVTPPSWSCCTYSVNPNGSYVLTFTAQDTGSGLQSITATELVNATASIPSFPVATTNPVSFTATESGYSSYVTFQLQDVAGNVAVIDPVFFDPERATGKPIPYAVKNITPDLGIVTIRNGTPGLKNVRLEVGQGQVTGKIQVAGLKDGEVRVVSIVSLLPVGPSTVTITPLGKPGGSALFIFGNQPLTGN